MPILSIAGLKLLVQQRPAFGLTLVTILVFGIYIQANYQRLEHYLLVPWLILALGVAVAVNGLADLARGVAEQRRPFPNAMPDMSVVVGALALVDAVKLASSTWASTDRSADRSGKKYVAAVFAALPTDTVILSE